MDSAITIVIAFTGAAFGAYFAVIKSKKERIWKERYEALHALVCDLDLIYNKYSIGHMEGMGVSVSTVTERQIIDSELDKAKLRLSTNVSKLQLLFKNAYLKNILEARIRLNSAILDLYNSNPSDYPPDNMLSIASRAAEFKSHVIELAQLKCI